MAVYTIDNQDMTAQIEKYSQEVVDNFGFYRAVGELTGSRDQLQAWFNAYLFAGLGVYDIGTLFEGLIAELVLTLDGRPLTIGIMEHFYNRVKVIFRVPESANISSNLLETGWIENPASIQAFGIYEHVARPPMVMVYENAERYAQMLLSEHSIPRKRRGRNRAGVDDGLKFTAVGRCDLANRRYVAIPPAPDGVDPADVEPILVTDYARQIVGNNPWLRIGQVDRSTATIQVVEQDVGQRYVPTWTRLQELAEMASVDGHPFMVQAWEDGRVDFVRKDPEPIYFWENGYGELAAAARPGMATDKHAPTGQNQAGTWYRSPDDYWIGSVEYSNEDGVELVPSTEVDEADKIIAMLANAT